MLADPVDQRTLLTLADLDAEVARVQHTARSLPQHKSIAELMAARQQATDELIISVTEVDDLQVAVAKAEVDLAPVRARLVRDEKRIVDGSVTDGKILRSLQDEVEHLKRRISDLEDDELECMARLEDAAARRDRIAARKAEIEARLREEVALRDEQVARLSQEAKDLSVTRAPIAALVPADASFGADNDGIGAERMVGLRDLLGEPANLVLRCVECDRILVRTEESGL